MCYTLPVKTYIHARLTPKERALLEELKKTTGHSESELVRQGLRLIWHEVRPKRSALELAGDSAGKFKKAPSDLATNKKHLEGFGK
jgi:Arc/MetJ-type ribon-helix-helix transcriptional regulator